MRMTLEEAVERYGQIVDGLWGDEQKHCTLLQIPDDIAENWINSGSGSKTKHVYCNKDMADPLLRALLRIQSMGLLDELNTFDGCKMIRDVRGDPGKPSTHSYALAIDLNAAKNRLGQPPTLSLPFVQCFKDEGFSWGGEFSRVDGMHFSFAWE